MSEKFSSSTLKGIIDDLMKRPKDGAKKPADAAMIVEVEPKDGESDADAEGGAEPHVCEACGQPLPEEQTEPASDDEMESE